MRQSIGLVVAVFSLVGVPAAASASTLYEKDGVLRYEAAPGEQNAAAIFQPPPGPPPTGAEDTDHEHLWAFENHRVGVATGEGCATVEGPGYHSFTHKCEAAGVSSVFADFGDGDDTGAVTTDLPATLLGGPGGDHLQTPLHGIVDGEAGDDFLYSPDAGAATIRGGSGLDTIYYGPTTPAGLSAEAVRVSLDGQPGDGRLGAADNVLPDVENVDGSGGEDVIVGSDGPNALAGGLASDTISARGGDDSIDAIDVYIDAQPHGPGYGYRPTDDVVRCGRGHDEVNADEVDVVARDCERVTVNEAIHAPDELGQYDVPQLRPVLTVLNGGDRSEWLIGTRKTRNLILGRAGADSIVGGNRHDVLLAGDGPDVIRPGAGRDGVRGGTGADVVLARDRTVDHIRCGSGRDRAVVDRRDRVARDCEIVARRRR